MTDEPEILKKEIAEMRAMLDALQTEMAPIKEAQAQLVQSERLARQEYEAKVAKIREDRKEYDTITYQLQVKLNRANEEIRRKQREFERIENERKLEEQREALAKANAILNEEWDRLTMGATWREMAKDHQIAAGHYLTENRNVILADPMGLGKTLSSIITCDMVEAATRNVIPEIPFLGEVKEVWNGESQELKVVGGITRPVGKRVIYFCPSSLMRNVRKEFNLWAKHRNVTFLGGMSKAERDFVFEMVLKDRADFVVIVNYEAWRKDLNLIDRLAGLDPDVIILDEAHNLKETKSIAYRGIKRLLESCDPAYIIPMTGTPILNRPQELFSLLTLVNPKEFYHLNDFLYNFCEQNDAGFWKFQEGGLERVARKIRKNFLRRTRDQAGIKLPEKTIINHDLEVDIENYPNQARVREQMRKYATIMIDEKAGKAIAAAAMIAVFTRLRQIETWPAGIVVHDPVTKEVKFAVDVEESQKLDYVISNEPDEQGDYSGLIPEVVSEERVVVFSQFKAPLRELKTRIEKSGYRAVIMDGEASPELREEISNDFDARYTPERNKSKWDVVLCNYKVGGVGINLTAATQMVILDEEWNPGKRDQAYDRIYRMGQEKPVTIHVIRNQKTIDDWLANIMENKEDIVDGFNSEMVSVSEFKEFLDSGGLI